MPWKKNKSALVRKYPDLEYLPHGCSAWDCTLSCLAYGMRMDLERGPADLNVWASRHGLPPSGRYAALGPNALVLWHGTSRERAEKIRVHGLFHKRGLWTARHPRIPHAFCRMRADRFGTEGAVVCILLDGRELVEGRDYELVGNGNTLRFHSGLPPEVLEYLLVREEIQFTGADPARTPVRWPSAQFRRLSSAWRPAEPPVARFPDGEPFASLDEFVRLCVTRLLAASSPVSPLELLSVLHSLVRPWDCLRHNEILEWLGSMAAWQRRVGKWLTFSSSPGDQGPLRTRRASRAGRMAGTG